MCRGDSVRECGFPVCGRPSVGGGSMNNYVQVILAVT
jgi:hypothetical protein